MLTWLEKLVVMQRAGRSVDPSTASLGLDRGIGKPTDYGPVPVCCIGALSIPQRPSMERDRKAEHIELASDRRMRADTSAFDDYSFEHNALPELDFAAIDTSCTFLGKELAAPILISCMTGGTGAAAEINRNLAEAAERCRVAVGVGSQRKALEDPATRSTFAVRERAPSVPILGNLGAVQLNYGYGVAECREAVEMIDADALVLHLNPLQEVLQPEGDRNFAGLLPKIAQVAAELGVPVVAKEVGSGLSESVGIKLVRAGVRILDTAGVGGTSWASIEAARREDAGFDALFKGWGISTPESIVALSHIPGATVIGSGGVRHGVDIAKAIAMGAQLAGLAQPFLAPALVSADAVCERIDRLIEELKIAMLCVGAGDLGALGTTALQRVL